jgi:hypothetical protein
MLFLRAPADAAALVVRDAPPDSAARVAFLEGFEFLTGRIATPRIAPGEPLRFSTWWRRSGAAARFAVTQIVVVDAAGEVVDDRVRFLGYTLAPPQEWAAGEPMREDYRLPLPPGFPPGAYTLGMRVWLQGSPPAPAETADGALAASGGFIPLGEFAVAAAP